MLIEVHALEKHFADFNALDKVSLSVSEGELIALLGPSGSGKTTLLRIIAGLERPDRGSVMIGGKETSRMRARERQVGFVFQHYALFKHMTVFDNVAFGLTVRPRDLRPDKAEIRRRVMRLLKLVHLDQFEGRYPSQLSGGQRQRVALARALAVEPKLLLLDEPFGALDAKVRQELRRWLRRLHEEMKITTLFVTHDQEEALEVADRVVVMNQGKIEQVGTPEDVYHRPASGFVYDFLGNYNEFAAWKDEAGAVHLAEDDLWEQPVAMPSALTTSAGWLSRYPEISGFLRRYVGGGSTQTPQIPSVNRRKTRQEMRVLLEEKGVPLRVFVRPHEVFVTKKPEDGQQYIPTHVVHMNPAGALVKLELARKNGLILQAEVPKAIVDSLAISKGDELLVRPKSMRVFE